MQEKCYLTTKQKELLRNLVKWLDEKRIPVELTFVFTSNHEHTIFTNSVDNEIEEIIVRTIDFNTIVNFIECGFFQEKSDGVYFIQKSHIQRAIDNNFGESMQQPIPQNPQKNYKGLTEAHWNFLVFLKNALKGKYLTNKSKTTFYIRPIIEEGDKIVDFEGFAPIFLNAHRNELPISMKLFLDLASLGYLEKARYGHYHIKDKKFIRAVDEYLAQASSTTLPTNSAFRLPDTSPQFQCDIFMVMPFREHLNPVYNEHIKPLAEELGYSIKRGDDTFSKHDIITEIWSLINNARLIIADCTDKNANVFYEMGLAHAIDKPVILITQKEEDIPFDIRQRRFIKYSPDNLEQLKSDLKKAIESILG